MSEENVFYGREEELRLLRALARDLSRGWGWSLFLGAPPATGKTRLLRHFSYELFQQGGPILPFYYAFPETEWRLVDFALHFTCSFSEQYLSFKRRESSSSSVKPGFDRIMAELRREDEAAAEFLTDRWRLFSSPPEGLCLSREVSMLTHHFSEFTGIPVLSFLDDLPLFGDYTPTAGKVGWAREALRSKSAPSVITGRSAAGLNELFGRGGTAGTVECRRLDSLSDEGAERFLRGRLRAAGVEMEPEVSRVLVRQVGANIHYLELLVRSIADFDKASIEVVQRMYAASVCEGEINRYWMNILFSAMFDPEQRRNAVEVLIFCLRESEPQMIGELAARMMKSGVKIEEAVEGLEKAGIVEVEGSRVAVVGDPVFRDVVSALYRREAGVSPKIVEASLVAEKMKEAERTREKDRRAIFRLRLKGFLESWCGQEVPKVLFSLSEYEEKYSNLPEQEQAGLMEEGDKLILPRVVSVASGKVGQETAVADFSPDALAWAFRGEEFTDSSQACWIVKYFPAAVTGGDVSEFERKVSALRTEADFTSARVVKWIIAGEGITSDGRRRADKYRILTSAAVQLEMLRNILGSREDGILPLLPQEEGKPVSLEFEMTIPMASETELIAARAVEQLAENLNVDSDEIERIKLALVEACINAFEHSGGGDGKVHLFFSVQGEMLRIRVENQGIGFAPASLPEIGEEKQLRKRGWGLSLIRKCMDEAEFIPREDGASLSMVKRLKGKDGSRG